MSKLGSRQPKTNVFKNVTKTPSRFTNSLSITNTDEAKHLFQEYGIAYLQLKGSPQTVARIRNRDRGDIRFEYFAEAKGILEMVKEKFGDGKGYIESCFGKQISNKEASKIIADYLNEHNLDGQITVYWSPDLTCSASMMWRGPNLRCNKPEARKYTLLVNKSPENIFLREKGIHCLMDHEIGTHYFRMRNDGLQPWFSDRNCFGLQPCSSRQHLATEEGLATINTAIQANNRHLWHAAILYYTACLAADMTFKELFDHLETYIKDRNHRWRLVTRVKRCLQDPNGKGGYGNDQIYFEGAVQILRCADEIDFAILYSGKMTLHELKRIHRVARTDCIYLPHFIKNIKQYRRLLHEMLRINKLDNCTIAKQIKYTRKKSNKTGKSKQRKKEQKDNSTLIKTSDTFLSATNDVPQTKLRSSISSLSTPKGCAPSNKQVFSFKYSSRSTEKLSPSIKYVGH